MQRKQFFSRTPHLSPCCWLVEELPDYLKQKLIQKCLYLRRAYQVALRSMDKGTNWSVCCQMAIDGCVHGEIPLRDRW